MSALSDAALKIAISQIGQKEIPLGSNWGHPVQDYLARVGILFPASWCMAFVYWCFDEAYKTITPENPIENFNPLIKTAGVLDAWEKADATFKVEDNPQVGDIFIMDFGKGLGHTGIIVSVENDHILSTIEGNTSDTGSREGIAVEKKVRYNQKPIIGYLRY